MKFTCYFFANKCLKNFCEKHRLLIVRTILFKGNKALKTQTKEITCKFDDFRQKLGEWYYSKQK